MTEKDNPITNTARRAQENPALRLFEAMLSQEAGDRPGKDIEREEAKGQMEVCRQTSRLPAQYSFDADKQKAALEAAGVVFGGPVEGDPIWVHAKLPERWKIIPTDHSMWSTLVDELGRPRARIFYKAAFYDRSCHTSVEKRFNAETKYPDSGTADPFFGQATDAGRVVWTSEAIPNIDEECPQGGGYDVMQAWARGRPHNRARALASQWLDDNRPGWDDFAAYWAEIPDE